MFAFKNPAWCNRVSKKHHRQLQWWENPQCKIWRHPLLVSKPVTKAFEMTVNRQYNSTFDMFRNLSKGIYVIFDFF